MSSETMLVRAAAVGAMMVCFAVVLGIGRMGKDDAANLRQAEAQPLFAPVPIVRFQGEPLPVTDVAEFKVFEPASSSSRTVGAARPLAVSMPSAPATSEPAPAEPIDATLLGVWAPDAGACSLRDFRQGLLPTIINANGAWAGETFCSFKNLKRTDSGWQVVATCQNADERWTTPVHLRIKGDRLTWASKRGTQVYRRCAPDFRVTAVQ